MAIFMIIELGLIGQIFRSVLTIKGFDFLLLIIHIFLFKKTK